MITTRILNDIDALDIFSHYLGFVPELQKMYPSPFRVEKNPSFNVYLNSKGELRYKDFGHSQGTAIDFVMNMLNLSAAGAKNQIFKDLDSKESIKKSLKKKKKTSFRITPREFSSLDKKYWGKQGISLDTLKKYKVIACAYVYINDRLWFIHDDNYPTYAYIFGDKVKIYRPFADKKSIKFIGNVPNKIPQGYDMLPERGDYLVITKSLKDVMFFYEQEIPAIAPHGEDMPIHQEYLDELQKRFSKFVVVYDNDPPGVKGSIKLTQSIGADYWNIPRHYEVKDITDFFKKYGDTETRLLLQSLHRKL